MPRSASPVCAGDGVDGGREGCERECDVEANPDAVVGEHLAPVRGELVEVRTEKQHDSTRDGRGQTHTECMVWVHDHMYQAAVPLLEPFVTRSRNNWKLGLRLRMILGSNPLAMSSDIRAVYTRSCSRFMR